MWHLRISPLHHKEVTVATLGDHEAVARARSWRGGVHVLVDLQGPTLGGRPELTALRSAPVQVRAPHQ